MNNKKNIISADRAVEFILQGQALVNYHIEGVIDLHKIGEGIHSELVIQDCFVEDLVSPSIELVHGVRLVGSHFDKCAFNYAYFIGGLTIDNCVFNTYLDFEAGGHNQNNCVFRIKQSAFNGFVNFFDCWFQSAVEIVANEFKKGTNLLGNNNKPYSVQFDSTPLIEHNLGRMDIDGEGGKKI